MPTIVQPPSEKLTKLKLYLEKNKTELLLQNQELSTWMIDRNLQVDQFSLTSKDINEQKIVTNSVEQDLVEKLASTDKKDQPLATTISKEEYLSILEKMVELLKLPAGQLEENSELYLEQQLSDILGFDVSANLDNHRLLFSTGIIQALPHLKRSPTDSLREHYNFHEAGIATNRSVFGWFGANSDLDQNAIAMEKYYIAVPLYYHDDWNKKYIELKKWYKFRKIVVINPVEQIAVVGVIGNIGPNTYTRRQFGGSPELIHAGKFWSPLSGGKVLVLFVDDPENSISLGPINFKQVIDGE